MMIKVEAYVREDKFEDVKAALNAIGVNGLTVSQVMGCGIQRGYKGNCSWYAGRYADAAKNKV